MKSARRWAGDPALAAGGIVLQPGETPRIAVVRLRKRSEWVLPKGKLDEGETARQAAEREVLEETGHAVVVHEFLGTLAYASGETSKAVHFWRMEADPSPSRALMDDVKAVDWLPLEAAVQRLSRGHERAFLAEVGPQALYAAGRPTDPEKRGAPARPSRPIDASPPVPSVGRRIWAWLLGR
jgi:8-oxo-dGTP diphosphatase